MSEPITTPGKSVHQSREHRRRRFRRHRRRAYIRSMYSLPSLATLGNAICGFASIYIAALGLIGPSHDPLTIKLAANAFTVAAFLLFLAMVFDGLDGRLARFARHTTDFGGQLDSLADMISFGAAPAFLALLVFKHEGPDVPFEVSRFIWTISAIYLSCAAIRLARFNVSNEHGEQHHFSFLGLPSPGAAGAVAGLVLMQQELKHDAILHQLPILNQFASICVWTLPALVLMTGLLMVSNIRYPHLINRYLRGKRSMGRLLAVLIIVLLGIIWLQYTLAAGTIIYAFWGLTSWMFWRFRSKTASVEKIN